MTARKSFYVSAVLAAIPLVAGLFGLYRFVSTSATHPAVTPIAGICQWAYDEVLDTAGHLGVALTLAILTWFTARAVIVLWSSWRRTAKVERHLTVDSMVFSALAAGFAQPTRTGTAIQIVHSPSPFALTVGYFRPRIILSTRLLDILDDRETEAVVRHELVHVARRDPLLMLLAGFFRAGLPFVPVLHQLLLQFDLRKEVEADSVVVAQMGTAAPLASALTKVLEETRGHVPVLASAGLNPTEVRIDALLGRAPPPASPKRTVLVGLCSLLTLSLMSGAIYLLFSSPRIVTLHICDPSLM